MRSLLKVLSKIAFVAAIADKAIEDAPDESTQKMYQRMDDTAMTALSVFPGQLSDKEIDVLHSKLSKFCDVMDWDNKKRHIHTYLLFSSQQLEEIRSELIERKADKNRIKAIESLIQVEADIYNHYADREYPLCANAGAKACDVWDQVWDG